MAHHSEGRMVRRRPAFSVDAGNQQSNGQTVNVTPSNVTLCLNMPSRHNLHRVADPHRAGTDDVGVDADVGIVVPRGGAQHRAIMR